MTMETNNCSSAQVGSHQPKSLPLDLLQTARSKIAEATAAHFQLPAESAADIQASIDRPTKKGWGDLSLPIGKVLKVLSNKQQLQQTKKISREETGQAICHAFQSLLLEEEQLGSKAADGSLFSDCIESFGPSPDGAHIIFTLKVTFTGQILQAIVQGNYLTPLTTEKPENVMIEYSQPNTHKAFHVGHMRNVALGDCLVRLQEHCGQNVIAANYFGDEGAHVAKCLWRLKQVLDKLDQQQDLASSLQSINVAPHERGEYLGKLYAEGVELTSLSSLTTLPCLEAIVAKVLTKEPHPNHEDKKQVWNVCTLDIGGGEESSVTVVCAGTDYEVGNLVAYMPVGASFNKKTVIPTDMKGILSAGMMLSYSEVGTKDPSPPKSKKDKKKGQRICLLDGYCNLICKEGMEIIAQPGMQLTELGRLLPQDDDDKSTVAEIFAKRQKEVGDVLKALESGDPMWCSLWETTKEWSLTEFRLIYDWLGARFDVDFYESQVSEPSMKLVQDWMDKGKVFEKKDGAIGVDLQDYKLPFLMVVKSNGSGLYATKDLALAQQKFQEYKIDRSVYVVDKGQSDHFKQVFATLDKMGFANAKKCFHLAYGQVVRPEGKMSSRNGTVIYFSALQQALTDAIDREFLNKYKDNGTWTLEEVEQANRAIAVGTIRYGMLNVDPDKDITFELSSWIAKKGNTGPYLMYAYARIKSILDKASNATSEGAVDLSLLKSSQDRVLLVHLTQFWPSVIKAATTYKPNVLCKYLYVLAQDFMSWYESSPILREGVSDDLKKTRLLFVEAVANVLQTGLNLLGITTLERM